MVRRHLFSGAMYIPRRKSAPTTHTVCHWSQRNHRKQTEHFGGHRLDSETQPGGQSFIPNFTNNLRLPPLPPLSQKANPQEKNIPVYVKVEERGTFHGTMVKIDKRQIFFLLASDSKSMLMFPSKHALLSLLF